MKAGLLDLTHVDVQDLQNIDVEGDAEFYWSKFIVRDNDRSGVESIKFPDPWNLVSDHPAHGFGSYRIRIKLREPMPVSLRFNSVWSSSKYYIDGRLVRSFGEAGRSLATSDAKLARPWIYTFTPAQSEFEVIIEVANFELFLGGAVGGFSVGNQEAVLKQHEAVQARGTFLLGALFIMGIYHLAIHVLRRSDSSSLYYGIFSLLVCAHLTAGDPSSPLTRILDPSFRILILLYNSSWMLATAAFCLYASVLFPKEFSAKFARIMAYLSLGLVIFIGLTPVRTFILLTQVYQLVMAVCIAYSLYAAGLATIRHREGARPFLISTSIMIVCAINDMLLLRGLLKTPPVGPAGVFIFTFGQSYLLSVRFSKAFHQLAISDQEIRQLNQTLEDRVEMRTRDIQSIMEHVPIGILSINGADQLIDKYYSKHLEKIINVQNIDGQPFLPLLSSGSNLSKDQLHHIEHSISASLQEDVLAFHLNEHAFPRALVRQGRHLHLTWNSITDNRHTVQKILITLEDVTEVYELERHAREHAYELNLIEEVLNVKHESFVRFIQSASQLNERNRQLADALQNEAEKDKTLKAAYLNLHTMKGDARSLKMRSFSDLVHQLEQFYVPAAYKAKDIPDIVLTLNEHVQKVEAQIRLYDDLARKKLNRYLERTSLPVVDTRLEIPMHQLREYICGTTDTEAYRFLHGFFSTLQENLFKPLHGVLADIFEVADTNAQELYKETPHIIIEVPAVTIGSRMQTLLQNIFVHILRNALDHGIESREERIAAGKAPRGTLHVRGSIESDHLSLRIADDGRGLNLHRLMTLADQKGIGYERNAHSVAELIFKDDLSTAKVVSQVSGRGIGMSAIRSYLKEFGGSIDVIASDTTLEERAFVPFVFLCELPLRYFLASLPAIAGESREMFDKPFER